MLHSFKAFQTKHIWSILIFASGWFQSNDFQQMTYHFTKWFRMEIGKQRQGTGMNVKFQQKLVRLQTKLFSKLETLRFEVWECVGYWCFSIFNPLFVIVYSIVAVWNPMSSGWNKFSTFYNLIQFNWNSNF